MCVHVLQTLGITDHRDARCERLVRVTDLGSHAVVAEYGVCSLADASAVRGSTAGPDALRDAGSESKRSGRMDDLGPTSGSSPAEVVASLRGVQPPPDVFEAPSKCNDSHVCVENPANRRLDALCS